MTQYAGLVRIIFKNRRHPHVIQKKLRIKVIERIVLIRDSR